MLSHLPKHSLEGACLRYPALALEALKLSFESSDDIPCIVMGDAILSKINDTILYGDDNKNDDDDAGAPQKKGRKHDKKSSNGLNKLDLIEQMLLGGRTNHS